MQHIAISLIIALASVIPYRAAVVDTKAAYLLLADRTAAVKEAFYVYQDADSGFNHGFPSGFFADTPANVKKIKIDTACLDDPSTPTGCSADPNRLDRVRVNVLSISFAALTSQQFVGVNIEEPEHWGANPRGLGYDLRGSREVDFDVRSPNGARVQFGVGECVTPFLGLSPDWSPMRISLSSLRPPPGSSAICPPNLSDVHVLFTVVTNGVQSQTSQTILLDNVRFNPVPSAQLLRPGFPLATQTFGVRPLQGPAQGRVQFPPDQVNRNVTTTYESALAILALLDRRQPQDLQNARLIADAFHYALHRDNSGDPLPLAPDGSPGVHNGYISGDLPFLNDAETGAARAGQIRLSGFTAVDLCPQTLFCLVLDGATGGNNAFAILALLAAFEQVGDPAYLDDARTIANWIVGNLTDVSGTGFGGYYLGYPDGGTSKPLTLGKSIENNADIFAAFARLADVEMKNGNQAESALWLDRAYVAGDFVVEMFDGETGCFFGGTVPIGTKASPGVEPSGPQRGSDVINTFMFLDSNSFTTLALAETERYGTQIDWRQPVRCILEGFGRTARAGGQLYRGFSIDQTTSAGPSGIAWEFTAQTVVLMKLIDELYGETTFEAEANVYLNEILRAQMQAPFGDGHGLVASTLNRGDNLVPLDQCLTTPFQCIPERVGLAATTWAIFAVRKFNPLSPSTVVRAGGGCCRRSPGGDGTREKRYQTRVAARPAPAADRGRSHCRTGR